MAYRKKDRVIRQQPDRRANRTILIRTLILMGIFGLAVFVPLGFFPALLFRNANWRRSALVGLGTSVLVEVGQYFLMRSTDIDDVILNTLGALCGFWLYLLLNRFAPHLTQRFQVEVRHGRETGDPKPAPGTGAGQL